MIGFGTSPFEILASQAMVAGLCYLDEFAYTAPFVVGTPTELGPSGDVTVPVRINSDSDFICLQYNAIGFAVGTPTPTLVPNPNILVNITRSGSGRQLMASPVHIGLMCGNYQDGTGNIPGVLPISSLYQGNSQVDIRLINQSNIDFSRLDFVLRGFKVFYQMNQAGQTGNRQMIFHAL